MRVRVLFEDVYQRPRVSEGNEQREDGVLVRDRQEVKHTQFIPLPEGTKVSSG